MGAVVTATPETALGRVRLDVAGTPSGDAVLVLRRDGLGTGVVRDTSEASALPAEVGSWRNLITNPSAVAVTGADVDTWFGASWTGADSAQVSVPWTTRGKAVRGVSATGTSASTYLSSGGASGPFAAGDVVTALAKAATSVAAQVEMKVQWLNAANGTVSLESAGLAVTPAGVPVDLRLVSGPAPAGAVSARLLVYLRAADGGAIPAVGGDLTVGDAALVPGVYTGPFFDGASDPADLPGVGAVAWDGTADASTSTATLTSLTVYDYEARQGEGTDYIAADPDGVALGTAPRLTIPAWGTWLKSPGRPYLNVRCYLGAEAGVTRQARREVVAIEGSDLPVVLSGRRLGARGGVDLLALDAATSAALRRLLDDGAPLMLDTHPDWQVAFRYISVGDVAESRPVGGGVLGLDREARLHTLSDVVAIAAPIGVSVVDSTSTYSELPTLYGSYAAMAATVPTYEDLVL